MTRLAGKVAVVLGAASKDNMGQVMARLFAQEGARIVVGGRHEKPLAELAAELDGRYALCDIRRKAEIDALCRLAIEAYTAASAGTYSAEFRIRRANDGALRWVLATGRVTFDRDGRPLRGVGTLQDIHERRQSVAALREREERLRIALVAGRMGAWRYDLRTGEQEWDETQYRLFGLDRSLKPTRELFLSVVHPDDLPKIAFDPATLHGSGPNHSGSSRPAITLAFAPAGAQLVHFHEAPDGHVRGFHVDRRFFTAHEYGALPTGAAEFPVYTSVVTEAQLHRAAAARTRTATRWRRASA